jgi:hypothetical protein
MHREADSVIAAVSSTSIGSLLVQSVAHEADFTDALEIRLQESI